MGQEEVRTAALVAAKLREWGVQVTEGVGRTGAVGTIRGRLAGQRAFELRAIGLRADMNALAIHEATGAARHLIEHPDFAGTIHLIFQPAEEGRGGALAMLADGLLERFPCDALYGMHNSPGMPVGQFGIRKGAAMAGGCMFHVRFTGQGGAWRRHPAHASWASRPRWRCGASVPAMPGRSSAALAGMGRGARDRVAAPAFLWRDLHPAGAEPRL